MIKKKRLLPKFLLILLMLLIAGVLVVYGICSHLALQDHIREKYTLTAKDDGFYTTILQGAVFGDEFEISEAALNTYINERYCTTFHPDESGIENIMLCFHKDSLSELYAKIYTHGKEYAVRANAIFDINSETSVVRVIFLNAYIGELKISDKILSSVLSRVFQNNSLVTVNDTAVSVKAMYSYEIKSVSLDIYLTQFEARDGAISCRTNSLTGEALKTAGEYLLSDEGQAAVSGMFNRIKEKIGSIFH